MISNKKINENDEIKLCTYEDNSFITFFGKYTIELGFKSDLLNVLNKIMLLKILWHKKLEDIILSINKCSYKYLKRCATWNKH